MRIFRRGSRWGIDYRAPGAARVREIVGTKEQAELALSKVRTEIFEGRYFPERRRRTGSSLSDLGKLWLEHAAKKRSVHDDKRRWPTIERFFGASRRVESIRPADVVRFRAKLMATITVRREPMRPATVNRHLALLRAALSLARREGMIHENPVSGAHFLREDNKRDRICTTEEYARLVSGTKKPHLKLAITIAYETAMRANELRHLEWPDIDLEKRIAVARKTKTGKARRVPLSDAACEMLASYPRKAGRLIRVQRETLSRAFSRLTRRLGIVDLRFHDLRHSAATRMRRAGIDIVTLKRIGGWETWAMMERYQNIDDRDLRDAVAKLRKTTKKKKPRSKK